MTTINENAWNNQDDLAKQPGYGYGNDTLSSTPTNAVDPDDDDDLEDDDLDADDDDLDFDDDDLDADDLDDDDDLDADDDGYDRVGGATATDLSSGIASSYDGEPNETPEQGEADNERQGYERSSEIDQQQKGDEASFSEQNDVTPPTPHEFPSTGTHTETNFEDRPLGRQTGRMVGHEPGIDSSI